MNNEQILEIAMAQSACDSHCHVRDFCAAENKVVISAPDPRARRYLKLPFLCDLTSNGSNIVASVSEPLLPVVREYIERYPLEHCFETPNLHVFMEKLRPFGCNVCWMAEYFLPDVERMIPRSCDYETRLLAPEDFAEYYEPEWRNALSDNRRQDDRLAVGAYEDGRLIGLAGCSADCERMWQIGVDVLPEYRRRGVAAAVTSQLAVACLERGIVPFYCCAWSNLKSVGNALKSGFRPGWIQLTVMPDEWIARMNHQ